MAGAEQMARMYGQGLHPEATPENPVALGPPFQSHKSVPERLTEARRAVPEAVAEEWERIEHKIGKAGEGNAVAGFDLIVAPDGRRNQSLRTTSSPPGIVSGGDGLVG